MSEFLLQEEYENQIGQKRASEAELDNLEAKLVSPYHAVPPTLWQSCSQNLINMLSALLLSVFLAGMMHSLLQAAARGCCEASEPASAASCSSAHLMPCAGTCREADGRS